MKKKEVGTYTKGDPMCGSIRLQPVSQENPLWWNNQWLQFGKNLS
jgi:hypothetical protein